MPFAGTKGCSIHLRAVAHGLGRAGHQVQVICDRAGAPVSELSGEELMIARDGASESWLKRCFEAHGSELVIERLALLAPQGARAAAAARIPHVYEVNAPLNLEASKYRGFTKAAEAESSFRSGFALSQGSVAVSWAVARWVRSLAPSRHSVRVIGNGVDPLFLEEPSRADVKWAAMALGPARGFRFGYVGSFKPWHDLDSLIDAAAVVAGSQPVQVALIGDGPRATDILHRAVERSVPVIMAGAVPHEHVPAYMKLCDAIVVPYASADAYFSPLKLMEAMATGRAVIASSTEPCRVVVRHRTNGLLVPPGDTIALAKAMAMVAEDPGLRRRLADQARRDIADRHTWDHVVRDVLVFASTFRHSEAATS